MIKEKNSKYRNWMETVANGNLLNNVLCLVFFPCRFRWMALAVALYILKDQNAAKMLGKPRSTRWTYAIMNITTHVDVFVLNTNCVYIVNGVWTSQIQRSEEPVGLILGMGSSTRKTVWPQWRHKGAISNRTTCGSINLNCCSWFLRVSATYNM